MSSEIIKHIENTQRPLIGLEYIALLVNDDNTYFKEFRCLACRVQTKSLLMRHVLKHVESVEHQLTYLVSRARFSFYFIQSDSICCVFFNRIQTDSTFSVGFWRIVPNPSSHQTADNVRVRHL